MAKIELLLNGALTAPFYAYQEEKKQTTAVGWAPWWKPPQANDPGWKNRQPVYSNFTLDEQASQQISTPWGTHVAGLWQQVPAATGNKYELTVEGQAWSSEDPNPATMLEASDVNLQIGIDPTGGLDPESPLIIWSEKRQPLCHWETLHLTAKAEASIITIYLKSAPSLPKRQQSVFWRRAVLRPIGRYKRSINIVGVGDTHLHITPEQPEPGDEIQIQVSSTREHRFVNLMIVRPDGQQGKSIFRGKQQDEERFIWRYAYKATVDGLHEVRFIGNSGARVLALRLVRVAHDVQLVPSQSPLLHYKRIYVLLPPTADMAWLLAAARGSFDGRFTIGFSADDAGMGDFEQRHVLAVNPHHWSEVLTEVWFQQHYPGVQFTAIVANSPKDLETWLQNWTDIAV